MTKNLKDKSLDFVVKYYKEGRLDTRSALKNVRRRAQLPSARMITMRQWIAIAASLLLLLCGGAYLYKRSHQRILLVANEKAQLFVHPLSPLHLILL